MKRKLIIVGAGVLLLAVAFFISKYFRDSKKVPEQRTEAVEKTVFTQTVRNTTVPLVVTASGNLTAKHKVELYSEVQGVLQPTGKDFRAGVAYNRGQTLLKINSDEHYATLQAQKSALQNLIASVMPDLRLDYPEAFGNWDGYLKNFNLKNSMAALPEPTSDKEKYFIAGKNIYATWYNVKNLEARLGKYTLKAPFNGILTEALVTDGTLVRAGQKMGEFIDPGVFELALSVNQAFADILKTGETVNLQDLEKTRSWTGKVSRINSKIDQASQTVQVFIELRGENLREGMYLEANVPAREETDAYEIDRKLLVENKAVYVVKDDLLDLVDINPVYFNKTTVVVKGLTDGMQLLSRTVPGAYAGMPVKVYKETETAISKPEAE